MDQLLGRYLLHFVVVSIFFILLILSKEKNRTLALLLAFVSVMLPPECPRGCSCSEGPLFTIVAWALPLVCYFWMLGLIANSYSRGNNGEATVSEAQTTEPSGQNPYANMTYA
jgi:hypothetical protein